MSKSRPMTGHMRGHVAPHVSARAAEGLRLNSVRVCVAWAGFMLMALPAAGQTWQVGTSPGFSSGRYGTDTRTEVLHTPITARRLFDAGDITLVFPFTCITGDSTVTLIGGAPARTSQDEGGSHTDPAPERPVRPDRNTRGVTSGERAPSDVDVVTADSTLPTAVRRCGTGDVVVRGRYYVVDQRGWVPTVAVRAHVKVPTASVELGLGTGRPDEGIGVEISRMFDGGVLAMIDGGYTVVGQRAGMEFNNVWWYDVGLGRSFANGVVHLSVFYEEFAAIVPGLASARDLLAVIGLRATGGWRIQVSSQFGLSDGAPDRGVTLGLSRRF